MSRVGCADDERPTAPMALGIVVIISIILGI